ncbi:MAG TPA: hypothetical protein VFA75_19695 [Nevskia sp.]|jgi:hypothetical protein|nr:hypothetical protein [Nevskia sp.]
MERSKAEQSRIDETLDDSFPASDPPSWTLGREPEAAVEPPPVRGKARRGREAAATVRSRRTKG